MDPKQRAAQAALQFIRDGMVVGLGTGSTADFFHIALADALRTAKLTRVVGVATSKRAEEHARELRIPLKALAEAPNPDVTVDGADEIAPNLDLIKGLGGALLREKIVAQASKKLVIIADAGKTVSVLGSKQPLPVEIAIFGHETHSSFLRSLGCEPSLRKAADGQPYITDNSNYIYDCRFPRIDNPRQIEMALKSRAGIVESGLFLAMADIGLIATTDEVKQIVRPA
jgi:ribose 5-phosphate isomerase A